MIHPGSFTTVYKPTKKIWGQSCSTSFPMHVWATKKSNKPCYQENPKAPVSFPFLITKKKKKSSYKKVKIIIQHQHGNTHPISLPKTKLFSCFPTTVRHHLSTSQNSKNPFVCSLKGNHSQRSSSPGWSLL